MTTSPNIELAQNYRYRTQPSVRELLVVFLVILISVSWVADIGSNKIQYSLILVMVVLIGSIGRFKFRQNFVLLFSALFISTFAIILAQGGLYSRANQLTLINLLLAVAVTGVFQCRGRVFLKSLTNILFYSVIISLVFYPLLFFADVFVVKIPTTFLDRTEFKAGRDLYTLFGISYFVSPSGFLDVWRNQSYYWEPGMFATILILALISSFAIGESTLKKTTYMIGIMSTFAVGGWAILVVFLGSLCVRKFSNNSYFFLTLLILPILVTYFNLDLIRELVLFLFKRDINVDSSVFIRSTDLWLPFIVAAESPILGHGNISAYNSAMRIAIDREMDGITNSLGTYFYRFGIPWGVFFCFIIARALKGYSRSLTFGFPVILLILVYEPLGFSLFFFCFIFIGLNNGVIVDEVYPAKGKPFSSA